MKIQWKYTEQASQPMADRLGKIVNVAGISTLFQSYFSLIFRAARRGGYFHRISIRLIPQLKHSRSRNAQYSIRG